MLPFQLIIVLVLGLPLIAAAQADPAPSAQVQSEYKEVAGRAIREFEAENFVEARRLFERAHELWPSARTLRTLGMTAFDLKRYPEALSELQAALEDPRRPLVEPQREQVKALLERTREAMRQTPSVLAQQDERLQPQLEPGAAVAEPARAPAHALVATSPAPPSDAFALARGIAFAAGAVGLATGVTAGILALDRSRVVGDECNDKSQCSQTGLDAAAAGRTWMIVSDIGAAVGVLGFSGWLLLPGGLLNGRPDDRGVALVMRGQFL